MKRWRWVLMGAGLAVRLALAWSALPLLLDKALTDDSFYYFVIARNLAGGLGASFDGLRLTNGFHPLWALLLVPIFRLANGELAVHFALSLSAVFDTLAAGALAVLAERLASAGRDDLTYQLSLPSFSKPREGISIAALVTASLYLFNPRLILESVNGLETALALLCMAWFLLTLFRAQERRRDWAFAGALAGLMLLARTDFVPTLFFALAAKFWLKAKLRGSRLGAEPEDGWQWGLASTLLVVAPWFAWSVLRFRTLVQSSAVAIPLLVRYRLAQGDAWSYQWPVINYSWQTALILPGVAWLALAGVLIYPRLAHSFLGRTFSLRSPVVWLLPTFVALGGTAIVATHVFVRWYPRSWYFAPLAAGVILLAGSLSTRALEGEGRVVKAGLAFVLAALFVAQGLRQWGQTQYPGQSQTLVAARWLAANTEPEAVIGAFNVGVIGYFSERRTINLDGAVNWDAIRARQNKELLDYFQREGGDYLIEREAYLWSSFGPFLGPNVEKRLLQIQKFAEEDALPGGGPLVVYQVGTR